jgi:hypothetical protein
MTRLEAIQLAAQRQPEPGVFYVGPFADADVPADVGAIIAWLQDHYGVSYHYAPQTDTVEPVGTEEN